MKRNIKKRRVVGTLSNKKWAQALEQFHRDEAEKWRKAEEQHKAEKRCAPRVAHSQAIKDMQHEIHVMLERRSPDPALYVDIGRILAAVRDKFLERDLNERRNIG
jgi:hypothetical protein